MKLAFLSTFDYPSRFAHAIHGLQMARAFSSRLGKDFFFLCNTVVDPVIMRGVRYGRLFGPFGRRIKKLRLRTVLFLPVASIRLMALRPSVLYTTEPGLYLPTWLLSRVFFARFVAECHGPVTRRERWAMARADHVFFVTAGLRERFTCLYPDAATSVLPNAVDADRFSSTLDERDERAALGIPAGTFLIGYIGRFEPRGEDKGVKLMIDSLLNLSLETALLLVGGTKSEIETYRAYAAEKGLEHRVLFVGHVPSEEVPRYARACDCLVYVPPSSAFTEIETSPMKLFEYMATGKPIIVSSTRAIRDVLRDDEAVFVTPGSSAEFVAGISWVRGNLGEAQERARRAQHRVASNTWHARVERIVQEAAPVV